MKHYPLQKSAICLAVMASLAAFSAQSEQQVANTPDAEKEIEVIKVTSRKREETLIEVPASVSSVSAIEISDRNLITKDDLYRTLAGAASPTGTLILRGLSGGNGASPSTTSSFTDDIPFGFSDLYDVEAVEVLRGPQGTLWGSNAIGGTSRVITRKPQLDDFEFATSVQSSDTQNVAGTSLQAWAAVNLPLVDDKLAMRITAHSSTNPGPIVNANTGVQNKFDDQYIRSQLLWKATDGVTLNLGYYSVLTDAIGTRFADLSKPNSRMTANTVANKNSLYGYDVSYNSNKCVTGQSRAECFGNRSSEKPSKYLLWESMDAWSKDRTNLVTLSADVDNIGDFASFAYAGSYRTINLDSLSNWSRLDMNDLVKTWIINYDKDARATHELRLQDLGNVKNLKWTVGAFYDKDWGGKNPNRQWQYHESDDRSIAIFSDWNDWADWENYWGELGIYNVGQLGQKLYGDKSKNYNLYENGDFAKEMAMFGEVSYTFETGIGNFEVTGGIRFFDLEDYASFGYSGIWEAREGRSVLSEGEESGNRKKLSVSWLPESGTQSVYALYSEGYRPGGNNAPLANACRNDEFAKGFVSRYKSDSIDNYEIGYKAQAGNLQFSSAVYQIDWSDVWASVYMPTCGFSYTANAAKARSRGVEWESKYSFDDQLELVFNASYTSSKMLDDVVALQAKKGQDMTQVPKYNAYIGLDKGFSMYNKQTYVRLDVEAYGEYKSHFGARKDGSDTSDAYERVNLSSRVEVNDHLKLSFHINNLLDKEIIEYKQARSRSNSTSNLTVLYAPERTYTLRMDYTFF